MSNIHYRFPTQYQQPGLASPPSQNMSSQRFCLRWNNHQSNLLSVFDQLLHDESFVDVTIAVEGQLLRAHKMVLSACSPYFQALFVNHPDKHPIVILKDVPYSDMRSLLDFMYRGEVSVDQDRLTAFLRVAESLRIKGLTEVNEEKCDTITNSLTQQQNQMNNIPNLHKLQQTKRFGNTLNMLGNALLQPKRKRVQGSPELLEVKMGMDGFTGNNSDSSTGRNDGKENDSDDLTVKDEPVAGTSKEEQLFNSSKNAEADLSEEYYDYQEENNQNQTNLPSTITLEVLPPIKQETVIISTEAARNMLNETVVHMDDIKEEQYEKNVEITAGVHFLTDDDNSLVSISENGENYERKKNELLEYLIRHDGSVVCKLCGEVLASRTHWYRHKYKLHVNNLITPAPLFKCTFCNVFFKSRKGYMGHLAARHSQVDQSSALPPEEVICLKENNNKVIIENPEGSSNNNNNKCKKKDSTNKGPDWEEQRVKEEKLVADIIDRVRKECEAQGAAVTRRGYSRRSTVMNSCN